MDLSEFKNPYDDQYVAPYGYSFNIDGIRVGRVIWTKNTQNITYEKD